MDPFTAILRALVTKKAADAVSDTATRVYNNNKETADGFVQGFTDAAKMFGREALPAAAASALLPGGIGTGLLIQQGIKSRREKEALQRAANKNDYEKIVDIAKNAGYTPSDAEVESILSNIRDRKGKDGAGPANMDVELKTEKDTPTEEEGDVIEYTYKPGDTFGQVLLNLGLSDGANLWGPGGDVEYYTQQLIGQNMLDYNGNVKLGIPFKLRRRK